MYNCYKVLLKEILVFIKVVFIYIIDIVILCEIL